MLDNIKAHNAYKRISSFGAMHLTSLGREGQKVNKVAVLKANAKRLLRTDAHTRIDARAHCKSMFY